MSSPNSGLKLHDLTLQILVVRPLSLLVTEGLTDAEGKQITHWLPRSQVEVDGDIVAGATRTIAVPEWLVREKGLTID